MGKKKGNGKGGAQKSQPSESKDAAVDSPLHSEPSAVDSSVAQESLSQQPSQSLQQQEEEVTSSNNADAPTNELEALRAELAAERAARTEAEAKLVAATQQIERLKSAGSGTLPPLPAIDPSRTQQLESLQKRIAALKAEQAEADAAREAAWKQLKSAVADIARLAAPDAPKASTPTAAAAATTVVGA